MINSYGLIYGGEYEHTRHIQIPEAPDSATIEQREVDEVVAEGFEIPLPEKEYD